MLLLNAIKFTNDDIEAIFVGYHGISKIMRSHKSVNKRERQLFKSNLIKSYISLDERVLLSMTIIALQ